MTGLKTTDYVGLGGVTVKLQGFLRATKMDGMDMAPGAKDPGKFEGIMGMGLPALAQDKYKPGKWYFVEFNILKLSGRFQFYIIFTDLKLI